MYIYSGIYIVYIYMYIYSIYIYIYIYSGRGFKSLSDQLSIVTSKNLSVVNTMCALFGFGVI